MQVTVQTPTGDTAQLNTSTLPPPNTARCAYEKADASTQQVWAWPLTQPADEMQLSCISGLREPRPVECAVLLCYLGCILASLWQFVLQQVEAELQPRIIFLNSPGAPRAITITINTYFHVICAGALIRSK
jgi:hypothetical protein